MKHFPLLIMVLAAALSSCVKESKESYDISYIVSFEPESHYVDVLMQYVPAKAESRSVTFKMPVWAPGYYIIMDYPKYLTGFEVSDPKGNPIEWHKDGKNAWAVKEADTVLVSYKVYANAVSVADSRVQDEAAFIAPGGIFLYKDIDHPVSVRLSLPDGWSKVSTALPFNDGVYEAPDFDVLYDSPMLIGNHYTEFREQDSHVYEFAVQTPQGFEESHIADDFLAGVREAVKIFGDVPYDSYHLLLLGRGPGGLEHQASQADYTSGHWDFNTRQEYLSMLKFLTHEYFHNYNVKAIRPIELGPFDYDKEVFTPMLWVSEGFTCYYESVLLERAGIISEQEHLDYIANYIRSTESTEGRKHMSMRQSSYDIWLNFFNRSANASDVTISYYIKGPVIGFLMDLKIRQLSGGEKSLDDLMNLLYWRFYKDKKRGFTEEEFWEAAEEVAGGSLGQIRRYVDTTEETDYESILAPAGLTLDRSTWTIISRTTGQTP